jgi:hypothetical protein
MKIYEYSQWLGFCDRANRRHWFTLMGKINETL